MSKRIGIVLLVILTLVLSGCFAFAPAAEPAQSEQLLAEPDLALDAPAEAPDEEFYAGEDNALYIEEEAAEEPMEEMALVEPQSGAAGQPAATAVAIPETERSAEQPPAPDDPSQDMFFEDYGTNPFVATDEDNLSTFAVDVDTGSYTLTRSYLYDYYQLPPPDAIRLEEFINYFDQDYPVPQDEAFNIVLEAAPVPFAQQNSIVLRAGIQGYEVPADQRPDANLIFVIDISGSMDGGNRLGAVKVALTTLVDNLRPTDTVGIVVYGSNGRVHLQPTLVSESEKIRRSINALQPDGSTNAEEGLRLAYEMATANFADGTINRLILCSDGVANVGATGPDAILEIVRQQARDGISLTTVGFGMGNYNDVLMEQLADDGDGQYFYVDSQSEAERVFVDDLTGTLLTIARDAKIQIEFNPETVAYYRLMGYENRDVADQDFRNDAVDAGEIGAGHNVTALYEVVLVEQAQGTLATLRLRWADPETNEVTEIEKSIEGDEVIATYEDAPPRFRQDVAAAAFADRLGAGAWSQQIDLAELAQIVEQLSQELANDSDVAGLYELIRIASELGG